MVEDRLWFRNFLRFADKTNHTLFSLAVNTNYNFFSKKNLFAQLSLQTEVRRFLGENSSEINASKVRTGLHLSNAHPFIRIFPEHSSK